VAGVESSGELSGGHSWFKQREQGYFQLSFLYGTQSRLLVAKEKHCAYCITLNEGLLIEAGFEREALRAAQETPSLAPLIEKEKALLLLVLKAILNGIGVRSDIRDSMFLVVRGFFNLQQIQYKGVYKRDGKLRQYLL